MPKPTELKTTDYQLYVLKLDSDLNVQWESILFPGRGRDAIELPSGKFAVVGLKTTAETNFPDLKSHPVLLTLDKAGRIESEKSLFFIDSEVEYPERMGETGEIGSMFLDDSGMLWTSGSNNLFEREDLEFYLGDEGYQLIEKNGFVYTLSEDGLDTFGYSPEPDSSELPR